MVTGQKRDTQYLEALLTKRIEFVKKFKCDLSANDCATAQTVAAYSDLVEEILTDIAVQTHRSIRTGTVSKESLPKTCKVASSTDQKPPPPLPPGKAGKGVLVDVFGQVLTQQPRDEVTCVHCGRRIAASRFAPHLEKCLGKGRNASRRRASNT
ncbi:probable Ataxin-7-like protein 3 [Coccomyxa sp. Obi]|nr:probable Ataxin-7-like protein 3 [Coccomyxa sp. Obi]